MLELVLQNNRQIAAGADGDVLSGQQVIGADFDAGAADDITRMIRNHGQAAFAAFQIRRLHAAGENLRIDQAVFIDRLLILAIRFLDDDSGQLLGNADLDGGDSHGSPQVLLFRNLRIRGFLDVLVKIHQKLLVLS